MLRHSAADDTLMAAGVVTGIVSFLYRKCCAFPASWGNGQALDTPTSTMNNTKFLDPYHGNYVSFSCLFLRQ